MKRTTNDGGLDALDIFLLVIFLLGIYTGYTIQLGHRLPFPSAPSGIAGLALLWRRRDDVKPQHLQVLFVVLLVYLASVLAAPDWRMLPKRFTGLVQLVYSLIISYAVFLTIATARRAQISGLFLGFCICIIIGCLLEDYGGLRPISDAVRLKLYSAGIYDADLRDEMLYGSIRPKLFTSEPSAVTFAFTLFAFSWLMASKARWKTLGYFALMAAGFVAMPGPTLLLMILLLIPYQLLVARNWASVPVPIRVLMLIVVCGGILGAFSIVGHSVYSARLNEIAQGNDESTFYRITGPALVAREIVREYPITGAGLTGEPYITNEVAKVYANSPQFSDEWNASNTADVLTNYFWLHWIYLGAVFGVTTIVVLSYWLKTLGVPSATFCWLVWAILGQASGAYVGPKTWAVLFLCAGCTVLQLRAEVRQRTSRAALTSVPLGSSALSWRRPIGP